MKDYSFPTTPLPDVLEPDMSLDGIPNRFATLKSGLSDTVLSDVRRLLGQALPTSKKTTSCNQQRLHEFQQAYYDDIRSLLRCVRVHQYAGNDKMGDILDYSNAAVVFDNCYLLLIKYWQSGILQFDGDDRDFILGNTTVQGVVTDILRNIIEHEFESKKEGLEITSMVGKIRKFENIFGFELNFESGSNLHPNFINLLNTERELGKKGEITSS